MFEDWSTIKKLIWRFASKGSALPDGYSKIAGITYDGGVYYKITDFFLKGSDTVRISFSVTVACNVFGCYVGTSATNNYSLYASTASGAKYLRYNGGTYKSRFTDPDFGQRYDVVITPTGSFGMPSGQNDTWTAADFTSESDLCIGTSSVGATSAKLKGTVFGTFKVDGRLTLIPCKRESDDEIGYYSPETETFYENHGSGTPSEYAPA